MATNIQGKHRQLYTRFKFKVEDASNGMESAAFQSCTGLKFSIAMIEYWEGGALAAHKEPGRATFDDLVLERGVSYDRDFYKWVLSVINMSADIEAGGKGELSPTFKRNLIVHQLDRDNATAMSYNVYKAFPTEWSPGDFDNTSDEITMGMLTLTYYYFTREEGLAATRQNIENVSSSGF